MLSPIPSTVSSLGSLFYDDSPSESNFALVDGLLSTVGSVELSEDDSEDDKSLSEDDLEPLVGLGNVPDYDFDDLTHQSHDILVHPPFQHTPHYQQYYADLHDVHKALQAFATMHQFAVARTNGNMIKGECYFKCAKGGKPSPQPAPMSTATTVKTDCPWQIYTSRERRGNHIGQWTVKPPTLATWFTHNHPPLPDMANSAKRKAEIKEQRNYILNAINDNVATPLILSHLHSTHPNGLSLIRDHDIWHMGYVMRKTARAGRSAVESAVRDIHINGDIHYPFLNDQRELIGLFYSTHTARTLAHRFPTIIFLDCTYKTNRYRLNMLHFCGFTSTNKTFTIAVMFMIRETREWYELALKTFDRLMGRLKTTVVITDREKGLINALNNTWPHVTRLTCSWHLKVNVKKRAAPGFRWTEGKDGKGWEDHLGEFVTMWDGKVMRARTEQEYLQGMMTMREKYSHPAYKIALDYIISLEPMREVFCHAWTDRSLHLGQRGNSRLEGNHRALKAHLKSHNQDMYGVLERLRAYMKVQWGKIMNGFIVNGDTSSLGVSRLFDHVRHLQPPY
jgi:hypothetical protein